MTWGLGGGDAGDPAEALGLSPSEIDDLTKDFPQGTRLSLRRGSVGKGAAGTGAAIIFELAEHILNDTASLIAVGLALRAVIRRTRERGRVNPTADAEALGPLAAAEGGATRLLGTRFVGVVPITASVLPGTTHPAAGTDARDIWAACFQQESRDGIVIFMSPTGLRLGIVGVPAEFGALPDGGSGFRDATTIAELWRTAELCRSGRRERDGILTPQHLAHGRGVPTHPRGQSGARRR